MGKNFIFKGDKEFEAMLKKSGNGSFAKAQILKYGSKLQRSAKSEMHRAYVKGYSKGRTAQSTTMRIGKGGLEATVQPHTEYAPYVELGTSKMSAEPALQPALKEVTSAFISDMKKAGKQSTNK